MTQESPERRVATGQVLDALKNGVPRELEYLMNAHQVAEVLNVSPGWVRDHATRKQPHIKCVHVGDLLRFRPSDVKEFIQQWCQ